MTDKSTLRKQIVALVRQYHAGIAPIQNLIAESRMVVIAHANQGAR